MSAIYVPKVIVPIEGDTCAVKHNGKVIGYSKSRSEAIYVASKLQIGMHPSVSQITVDTMVKHVKD
jgi:hypothetical protein